MLISINRFETPVWILDTCTGKKKSIMCFFLIWKILTMLLKSLSGRFYEKMPPLSHCLLHESMYVISIKHFEVPWHLYKQTCLTSAADNSMYFSFGNHHEMTVRNSEICREIYKNNSFGFFNIPLLGKIIILLCNSFDFCNYIFLSQIFLPSWNRA